LLIAFGYGRLTSASPVALDPTVKLLQTGIGPRYSFPTNVFLGLAVLLAFSSAQLRTPRRTVLAILLAGFLISRVTDSAYYRFYKAPPGTGPSWSAEARA
jgi:predicted benzoate:H+ symporter BenE